MPHENPFGDELDRKPRPKRQPTGEIVYIPTERGPSDWTKKDKRIVANAVCMGVAAGILLAGPVLFIGIIFLGAMFSGR